MTAFFPGETDDMNKRKHRRRPLWPYMLIVFAILAILATIGIGTSVLLFSRWSPNIVGLTFQYLNSTDSRIPGQASGGHAVGVYDLNFNEVFAPEPAGGSLALLGLMSFVITAARRSRTS